MRPRRNRPLFIIDIAVPRDVEPTAGEIEQVFLYNIDDLQATVRENLARRASEVARAETIVEEEVEKFGGWFRSRGAIPTVVALRERFETIMRPRRNRPLFIIDIAMPRDVEAAAGEIEQVFLYNIDDLQATVRENLARRASEVARAETCLLYTSDAADE